MGVPLTLGVLLLTAVGLALPQTASVQIPLPDWTTGGTCSVLDANRVVSTVQAKNSLGITCPAGNQRLSCDLNGAEPFDVPVDDVCQRGALPLLRATPVMMAGATDGPVTVHWLSVHTDGRIAILATRSVGPAEQVTIPVAVSPARLVRVSRAGFAPVTTASSVLAGAGPEPWRLPLPVRGGELVVQRAEAAIVPQTYRLIRNGVESLHPHGPGAFMALRGVPAGDYQLAPLYAGGVPAPVKRLRIEDGQATFLLVPREPVGGAAVTLHPAVCAESTRIQIRQLSIEAVKTPDGGQSTRTLTRDAATIQPVRECEPVIGGLPAGEYEFVLDRRQNDAAVRRRFEVRSDALTDVAVEPAGTRLSGKVTLNGHPLATVVVEFVPKGSARPAARGTTDDRGNYAADFDKAGPHYATLRLRGVPIAGQQTLVDVPAGETTFDWSIIGGAVTVKIENVATGGGGFIWLYVDQTEPPITDGRRGFFHTIRPDDQELAAGRLTFRGLGFGSYTIRATQQPARSGDRTRASRQRRFSLSEQTPDATVTLSLEDTFAQIALTDPAGAAIKGASIYGTGASARETEPGIYSLDGIPAGMPLQIRAAGYTPFCKVAPETPITVVLDAGRTVEVQFPGGDGRAPAPLGRIQWLGSDCPIALDAFPFAKQPTGEDGVPRFAIANFPIVGDVSHSFLSEPARSYQVLYNMLAIPVK
jgi:hypothetical protein